MKTTIPKSRNVLSASIRLLSTAMPKMRQHCLHLVRSCDYDGYLSGLFIPSSSTRASIYALRAFNIEISSIREAVRDNVKSGSMRVHWWADVLASIYKTKPIPIPPEPVCLVLSDAVTQKKLTRRWLERMLDARKQELEAPGWASMSDLEIYAENTASSLLYLSIETAAIENEAVFHAAGHIGKAIGISTLLRSMTHHCSKKISIVPSDVMRKHLLSSTVLFNGPRTEAEGESIVACVYEMACLANDHMTQGQELAKKLKNEEFRILLPGVRAAWYLEALEKVGFDPFHESLVPKSRIPFQLRMAKAAFTQIF